MKSFMAPVSVFDVAAYFIKLADNKEMELTPLKLQKIIYYAQAFVYVFLGKPLFKERLEAWRHGPVCPELYRAYRKYGYKQILSIENGGNDDNIRRISDVKEILDSVWEIFGRYSGPQLEEMTHQEKPWQDAIRRGLNSTISLESMKRYFNNAIK